MSLICRSTIRSVAVRHHGIRKNIFPETEVCACSRVVVYRRISTAKRLKQSAAAEEAIKIPQPESTPVEQKSYAPKITAIVDQISQLNLLEVADLNELLKTRLNISDAPVMMGGPMMAAAPQAEKEVEEEDAPAVAVQTSFTLKMEKYDEGKKVALIKEIKNQMEGMNLVQSKKFVESCPTTVKADIAKDEAEKLKAAFEAVGATCTIE